MWLYGQTDTPAHCQLICHGNSSCTGFTWHDQNQAGFVHDCILTSFASPWSHATSQSGHFSGMCSPPPPAEPPAGQCSPVINNANLVSNLPPGTWLADANSTGGVACEATCKANTTCTGFTWHDHNQAGYANNCFLTNVAHPWDQYTQQDGHESGLCNHGHRAAPPAALFVGHFGPGTPAPAATQDGSVQQSYGGRLWSPLAWPVPGNGNDRYHQQGYLDPAAGTARSKGLYSHRRGIPAARGAPRGRAPSTGARASDIYVDYGAGSDRAAGTSYSAPLKTIAAAVAKATGMTAPVTVHLVGTSTHYVEDTIKLTAAHSGMTITGHDGDAVVSGGVAFAGAWTASGNTSDNKAVIYTTTVPKGLSFLELFNTSTSARYVPAREPNGNPEIDQNNYGLHAANWLAARDFGKATLVQNGSYVDPSGKNVTINRGGMFDQYYMGVGGPADNFVPSISYVILLATLPCTLGL